MTTKIGRHAATSPAIGALLVMLAAGCGDDGNDTAPDAAVGDGVAPTVTIAFPPPRGWTGADHITVRGTATDADGVAAIRVNGVSATSSDGFATWQAEVPLEIYGANPIVVESEDVAGAVEAQAAMQTVDHSVLMLSPVGLAVDRPRNRALVAESQLRALLAIDMTTGTRSVISGKGVGTGPDIEQAGPIALEDAKSRVIAVDAGRPALLTIDIITGARAVLSDADTGTGPMFSRARSITLDTANERALVLDDQAGALLAVDLATGNRTVLSSDTVGTGPALGGATDVALDTARDRAVVLQDAVAGFGLLGVSLETGERTVISNEDTGAGPVPLFGQAIAIRAAGDSAFLASASEGNGDSLYVVDLLTGDRAVLSDVGSGTGPLLDLPNTLALDDGNGRAVVTSTSQLDALMTIDLDSGDRDIVSESRFGAGPRIDRPNDMVLDAARERFFVVQGGGIRVQGPPLLFEIDMATGARSAVSGAGLGAGPDLVEPGSLALVPGQERAFVVDDELQALISIDLATGDRTMVASADVGAGPVVMAPGALVFDQAHERLLALDRDRAVVVAIDPADGAQSDLSGEGTGTGAPFGALADIVLDAARNRVVVLDRSGDGNARITAVDLDSGDRQVLSGPDVGAGPEISYASTATLDEAQERVFVNTFPPLEIDLRTGNRVAHEDPTVGLAFPATTLAFDAARGYLWGGDFAFTLVVVDPVTDQVLLASH